MLSETVVTGLEHYRIGPKIRELRLRRQLGQVQLADHTGLSPALLSKIERGQLFPTLPTLLRIAMVFGVGLEHFFTESRSRPMVAVTRKADRLRIPDQNGSARPSYVFESLNFPANNRKMDAYYAEFLPASEPSAPHEHASTEFIYVLKGQLTVVIDGEATTLNDGDALYFDGSAPHCYQSPKQVTSAVVAIVP